MKFWTYFEGRIDRIFRQTGESRASAWFLDFMTSRMESPFTEMGKTAREGLDRGRSGIPFRIY